MSATDAIVVEVPQDLREVARLYLESRGADLARLEAAREASDFEEVRRIGHKLRGSSRTLGFLRAGEIGMELESAALRADAGAVEGAVAALREYFSRLSIRYV